MANHNGHKRNLKRAFPVVCIGMSSGAVDPLQTLVRRLSSNTGMAFVVIHHLSRYSTHLPLLLAGCTSMPVEFVVPGRIILPNHVYVLPSGQEMKICDGHFSLRPRSKVWGWTNVVSLFLESLTNSRHQGIAVILSGLDKDGAEALEAFKRNGGITIVQEPKSAKNPQMPEAAISTGYVNYVLPPEEIATQLEAIAEGFWHPRTAQATAT